MGDSNSDGSRKCICTLGYESATSGCSNPRLDDPAIRGNEVPEAACAACTDINECSSGNIGTYCSVVDEFNRPLLYRCVNSDGSYLCESCGTNAERVSVANSHLCRCKAGYRVVDDHTMEADCSSNNSGFNGFCIGE